MIWIFIRTTISFVEMCIYFILVECFSSKRSMPVYKGMTIFFGGYVLINIFVSLIPFNVLRVVLVSVMYTLLAYVLYEGKFVKKIIITIGFLISVIVAEILAAMSVPDIELVMAADNIHVNTIMVLVGITAKMIQYIGVNLIMRIKNRSSNPIRWSELFVFVAHISTILIIHLFIRYETNKYQPMRHLIAVMLICVGLLLSNVFIWLLFEKISKQEQEKRLYEAMQDTIQKQYQYYRTIEVRQEESKKMWHDINNHLNCIRHLIYTGHAEEANEYLNNINTSINKLRGSINTGNLIVDAILNDKYEIAQNHNISIQIDVDLLGVDFIQNIDMCTIFSNLVDNALEACIKQCHGPREISITAKTVKEFIIIKTINTAEQKAEIINNEIKTTKRNKQNHGIGLRNIRETVEKYDGVLTMKSKEDQFVVHIALPSR